MSRIAARVLITATLTLLPSLAFAQGGGSGSVVGAIFDQTGQPMPGVKVIARSPTQVGGEKVSYTSADGQFRFLGLMPGVFDITATAPKMATVHQKGIPVGINAPAEVNLVMDVQTRTEEVKVIERAPIVSTKSAVVKEQYDGDFLDSIPSDFKAGAESVVATSVPGAVVVGFRGARIRGGGQNHSAFLVEGFFMNGQRSTLKGMSAVEVQTGGYGAENATVPGGVVNMVTKSGSNKFEIDIGAYAEDNNFQFFLDNTDSRQRSYFYVLNPTVSGPVIKDKLWYAFNFELRPELTVDPEDPLGVAPQNPDYHYLSLRGSGKFTWQVNARNKLASFSNFNMRSNYNNQRGYGTVTEPEAQNRQDDRDFMTGLIWESLLTNNLFFKSQVALQRFMQQVSPQMCQTEPGLCDHIPATINTFPRQRVSDNWTNHTATTTKRLQFINTLEAFLDSKQFGNHNIRLKNDFQTDSIGIGSAVPGNRTTQFNGLLPDRQTEFFSNDPRFEDARYGWFIRTTNSWKNSVSLSDSVRLFRTLTLTPGIAFTTARASNNLTSETVFSADEVTPHIAAAWDATGDGRTVVRGSFNQYIDVDGQAVARFAVGDRVSRTCRWNAATSAYDTECTYGGGVGGRTVGLPCGPTGFDAQGRSCSEKLKTPRTTEYTLGAEREVIPGVALGIDFIHRKFANQFEQSETNRVWTNSGTDLDAQGRFRSYGTGTPQTVLNLGTPEGARRTYSGYTVSAHKREGAMKVNVGYTLSYLKGTVLDGNQNAYGDIGPRDIFLDGYLADDSRHNIRMTSVYQWAKWFSTGILYDYRSGRPYQRFFRNGQTGSFEDYRARVGINPGTNINDPTDDREIRLPDIQQLSLQFRVNFQPLLGINLDTYADVLNALALRTGTAVIQQDGPLWGSTTGDRLAPFRLRLGVNYRW